MNDHVIFHRLLASLIAILAISFLPLMSAQTTHAAGANNFTITSFDIDFKLGRDSDNRSTLTTKETITANFPESDENHGLERAIPKEYNGHPTHVDITSVTDQSGQKISYSKNNDNDLLVLRIGSANSYVHGKKTYVITYTQHDVTRFYKDTNADEFYWDTNGTDWKVPIDKLHVTVSIDESLKNSLNGNTSCYQGTQGSGVKCTLAQDGTTYTATVENLKAYENVTVAFGFTKGTFATYKITPGDAFKNYFITAQVVSAIVAAVLLVLVSVKYFRQSNRRSEQNPIAPEYLPPEDGSVAEAAKLFSNSTSNSFSAQLIDLAVRGYIKIYEVESKALFGKKTDYKIEIVKDVKSLKDEEQEFVKDVFQIVTVGSSLAMKDLKKDTMLSLRLSDNDSKLSKLEQGVYALRQKATDSQRAWYKNAAIASLVIAIFSLTLPFLTLAAFIFLMQRALYPLTDKGLLLLRRYKGLKMYIKVAEADRLKMLQSPDVAEKVSVDTNDKEQLIKLYEKVLPYAMLFGQSKAWNKQLGQYYNDTNVQPNWYVGMAGYSAFSAASFESAINSFSSSAASSSGAGGSSGGGSSGGGGGGGGGGGW